ncbi:MAG: hypothetical protein ACJAZ2_002278 [Glaciecola sp.]|jgi:hypothetical protein
MVMSFSLLAKSYNDYKYSRTFQSGEGSWQKLYAPTDLYNKISSDFKDVRLLSISENNDTLEEPYFIQKERDEHVTQKIDFKLINEVQNHNGYYYTFDVGQTQVINQIVLLLNRNNFDKHVRLEGSQDMKEWFTVLKNERILAISNAQTSFRHTTLNFNDAQYKYFRVLIKGPDNPSLNKAQLKMNTVTHGELDSIKGVDYIVDNKTKPNHTIIDVKLGKLTPIDKIQIRFKDTLDYYRPFKMSFVTDSFETEKGWIYNYQQFFSGTFSSFQKTDLNFKTIFAKTIRIEISNHDNQSLTIRDVKIQAFKRSLITKLREANKQVLVYGNPSVNHPIYDIVHFKKDIPDNISIATLGPEVENAFEQKEGVNPLFENENWLWGIMAVVIIVIGGFTFKMMKE